MAKPFRAGMQQAVQSTAPLPATKGILTNPQNSLRLREVWLDGQDIKQWLHISERTLQTWRTDGILPYYKVKKKIWYKQSEVDKLLERSVVIKGATVMEV